jgi:hypothetical protein
MPQGSLKKIEADLLLTDLLLKLRNSPLRQSQLVQRRCWGHHRRSRRQCFRTPGLHRQLLSLGRAAAAAQRDRPPSRNRSRH